VIPLRLAGGFYFCHRASFANYLSSDFVVFAGCFSLVILFLQRKKSTMTILMVLTSHAELGQTDQKTGFWVEEFAAPYYVFADAGAIITLASPKGGQPPIDPKSEAPDAQTAATKRFYKDAELREKLSLTMPLNLADADDYDAVFYPGGHGPLWDLSKDPDSIALIETFSKQQKPMAFVCHAPAALVNVKGADAQPLVNGKTVTGFSNTEEAAVHLTEIVPFLLEDELARLGGKYSKGADWSPYVLQDGQLITGQNPASSAPAAELLLKAIGGK
jgi:putative intracellular protease/amidase